jgi:hypothetical protein
MRIDICIEMDNDAFCDDPAQEVARILREYADKIECGGTMERMLADINGNCVGSALIRRATHRVRLR